MKNLVLLLYVFTSLSISSYSQEPEPPWGYTIGNHALTFDRMILMENLLAILCMKDGSVDIECFKKAIKCSYKINPEIDGADILLRGCSIYQ